MSATDRCLTHCPCGHLPPFCHVENARKWCGQSVALYTEGVRAESATDPDRIAAIEEEDIRDTHKRLRMARRERDEAVAENARLTREVERLRAGLVVAYCDSTAAAVAVARACDEVIDPSGKLLGEIRREALRERES